MNKADNVFLYKKAKPEKGMYLHVDDKEWVDEPILNGTLHWHDYFEMEFIYCGSATHIINGERRRISRGSAYLLTPVDFHTVVTENGEALSLMNISFNEYALPQELVSDILGRGSCLFAELDDETLEEVLRELRRMIRERENGGEYAERMKRVCFEKAVILFMQKLTEGPAQSESGNSGVHSALSYLKYNFRRSVTLGELAEHVHLTPNYFGELFKSRIGVTYTDYLKKLRLDYARNLLENSELSVAEVAAESGFNSTSYFIGSFGKSFGITPNRYRASRGTDANKKPHAEGSSK